MGNPSRQRRRFTKFSDRPFVKEAVARIEKEGLEHADLKDIILLVGSDLNNEIEDIAEEFASPIKKLVQGIWLLVGSIIAGIIAYIVISLVA